MKRNVLRAAALALCLLSFLSSEGCSRTKAAADIPLPEHPRPDFQRKAFVNLNGHWNFTFDKAKAEGPIAEYDEQILVPFPWGSKLSEVENKADTAWYGRQITVPSSWKGKRIFLVVGASDWETTAWIDGKELGNHQGGYTPFAFELTDDVEFGKAQDIRLKVADARVDWHLYGKQGYGDAKGIWQTVYLEARGGNYLSSIHFTPDIDNSLVRMDVSLDSAPAGDAVATVRFKDRKQKDVKVSFNGRQTASVDIPLKDQHLWDIDDPYLYEVSISLAVDGKKEDEVESYFGQRKVSAMKVPGQGYKYVALNNHPLYLQLTLDQSYHPEGFYTFPSDEFMKDEILLSKKLGLNGNRVHIKVEVPRKLYWADRLGLLIMADVPNFWGEPGPEARQEWESCMRDQVERDFNHPSIFAWVDFNETWGLFTNGEEGKSYTHETQEWVRSMYHLTKELDPTRLVEDNSACNQDHVETDINSWHSYQAGHRWEIMANYFDKNTVVGSGFNYIGENTVQDVPMINSECGNVWGYEGSAGDCDYSWDYHCMMDAFHRHLKIGGWLYTEHHDVINEWNGYVKFDRSEKIDGLCDFVPGMTIADFHTPYYIVPAGKICRTVPGGSVQTVKLSSSFTTDKDPGKLELATELGGWKWDGTPVELGSESMAVDFKPFELAEIGTRTVSIPSENGVYVLRYILKDAKGKVLSRNFCLFVVNDVKIEGAVPFAPASYTAADWSVKSTVVLDSLKVNGFGHGAFEYSVTLPENLGEAKGAEIVFEASAKQLFGKDCEGNEIDGDYMLGGGTFDPCKSPNSYAMTDGVQWKSKVCIEINGIDVAAFDLEDDPADHRGVLSWNSQPAQRWMREGGSYGYLIRAEVPSELVKPGAELRIKLSAPESGNGSGGLAIYGKDFGRYPVDPCIILK